jgi:hypothetical protein
MYGYFVEDFHQIQSGRENTFRLIVAAIGRRFAGGGEIVFAASSVQVRKGLPFGCVFDHQPSPTLGV